MSIDIMSLSQIAAWLMNKKEEEVTRLDMGWATRRIRSLSEVQVLLGGKQIHWPGENRKMVRVYAIRNAELYDTKSKILQHLQGIPAPKDTANSRQMKLSRLEKRVATNPELERMNRGKLYELRGSLGKPLGLSSYEVLNGRARKKSIPDS